MEIQTDNVKKKSSPKWVWISLLIVGVILIAVGLLKIFGSGMPNAFVDKFNEVQVPNVDIKNDLASVGNILLGISAKETKKDYAGIISDLQTALAKLDDAEAKVASTSILLTEFQSIVDGSSDQNIKTTGARFIDVFKSKNTATLKMVSDGKSLVNQAITYYNEVAHNQKITIDMEKFNAAGNAFAGNAQIMTSLGAQYETAANDFAKAAGFTIKKK